MALVNLRHLSRAGIYALAGIRQAWRQEQAFKHEVLGLGLIVILLFVFRPNAGWCAAALGAWLALMALELLNSAIEEAFDLISPEYHPHVKYGKDMASGAILLGLAANAVLWVCLLWDVLGA